VIALGLGGGHCPPPCIRPCERCGFDFLQTNLLDALYASTLYPGAETLEWDILNPDRLINLEINNKRRISIIILEIKKKSGSSINPDIHQFKVPSSG